MSTIRKIFEEIKRFGRGIKNLRFFRFKQTPAVTGSFGSRERIAFAALAIIFVADLAAIGIHFYLNNTKKVPANGGTYIEGLVGQPQYINPLAAVSQTDKDISKLVYAGLYKYDQNGALAPDLASGMPEISRDGKQYTITLKDNLRWSDGQPITTDDLVFTISLIQSPLYKIAQSTAWQNISVTKVSDKTITLTDKFVSAPFMQNLTVGILPKHVWSAVAPQQFLLAKYNLEPVASGPYFIKEIKKTAYGEIVSMTLESFSDYWQGKAPIDTIVLNFYRTAQDALFALHSKQIQGFGFIPFDAKIYVDQNKNALEVSKIPVYEYQALFFNLVKAHNVLGDPAVRQALAKSIDRNQLIQNVYFGLAVPAYSPIMPGQVGYNPDIQSANNYDLSTAADILEKAGWAKNPQTGIREKSGQQLQFAITTNDFVLNSKSAQELADQWEKIGAKVSVNIIPTQDLENNYIKPRNFDALLFAISTGADPDPFIFWHSSQAQNPGLNIAQYKNASADALISAGRTTLDSETRAKDYQQFQSILAADTPAIFLAQNVFVYQTDSNLQGLQISALANPEDRFYDVGHWYIETRRVWK